MRRNLLPLALIILVLIIGSRLSEHFLDFAYLRDSATLVAELGIIALAMNFVITAGQIDLSVGSNMVLTACLTAKLIQSGVPAPIGLVAGVAIATLFGLLNGLLITKFRAPSFLITVATLAIFRGAAKALLGPSSVKLPPAYVGVDTQTLAGLTVPLVVLLALTSIAAFIMGKTIFGRWTIATGANQRTALYSGVPINRVITWCFILTGFASGIASMLMLSRLGLARADIANGAELDIITIVVVGGTAIKGGHPNVLGSLLAFILIALLRTAMGVASITADYQMTIIGILLILVVLSKNIRFRLTLPQTKRTT